MNDFKILHQTTTRERTAYIRLFAIFFLLGFVISVSNAQTTQNDNRKYDLHQTENISASVPIKFISN